MVNEKNENCLRDRLWDYLYWIDVERFSLLREEPCHLMSEQFFKEYARRQKIGTELLQFSDLAFRFSGCPDKFFNAVSNEVHDERIAASDRIEELMRRSIIEGLSKHVRACKSCRTKYDNFIEKLALERINSNDAPIEDLHQAYESSYFRGVLTAEKRELDLRLLGLFRVNESGLY